MAETTAAAYPDLLAPARRLGGRLAAQLEAERDRWALWIPVGFASGACARIVTSSGETIPGSPSDLAAIGPGWAVRR